MKAGAIFLIMLSCTSALVIYNPKDIDSAPMQPVIFLEKEMENVTVFLVDDDNVTDRNTRSELENETDTRSELENETDASTLHEQLEFILNETVDYVISSENKTLKLWLADFMFKSLPDITRPSHINKTAGKRNSAPSKCNTSLCEMYRKFYRYIPK